MVVRGAKAWTKGRLVRAGLILLLAMLVLGELLARFALGLGTPPLSVTDPEIEYRFASNQEISRFHNRQFYNEYGMRSDPIDGLEADRRILVLGDSVLNGGSQTDQTELATEILSSESVYFGNVSAGSWGPANMAAWVERYGYFDADTVILVLSSHDLTDTPTFAPLNSNTHPTSRPVSALVEAVVRYLPRYLPTFGGSNAEHNDATSEAEFDRRASSGEQALAELIRQAAVLDKKMCLVQHLSRSELDDVPERGHGMIRSLFVQNGVPVFQMSEGVTAARDRGETVFRDNIHINAAGQEVLAQYLERCAAEAQVPSFARQAGS